MKNSLKGIIAFITLFAIQPAIAQIKLPHIIRDSMVLQRERKINIWGWASKGEKVTVRFKDRTYTTRTGRNGKWMLKLPAMEAGGPYTMQINGKNSITLHDILIGDVWFCSGQSNMVHQMKLHSVRYSKAIASAHYPEIRQFWIPTLANLNEPQEDLPAGSWKSANPKDVLDFSAVAYFFAKKLYQKYHIPIGIINASVGGTPIEAWTSEEGLKNFPSILKEIQKNKDTAYINNRNRRIIENRKNRPKPEDKGLTGATPWYDPAYVPKEWRQIGIPGYWEDQGVKDLNGIVWYRRVINVPASMTNKPAKVFLGRIVDADVLYINGRQVGHTTYQYPQRRYPISAGVLKPGKNVFVVRVTNHSGKGGFVPDKPYCLIAGNDTIDLKGYWQYKVGSVFDPRPWFDGFNLLAQNQPTALYNAMVAPVIHYSVKGMVWYQGAANTARPAQYAGLLPALIADWRSKWREGDIPFLYVQLPGYGDYNYLPSESNWAVLREAQLQSLSVPNTAMAVTIDLGEWNDIHPDRKKPVGERLALAAEKIAYGENVVYSGPVYQSSMIEGNKMIISFTHAGSGLIFKDSSYVSPGAGEVVGAFTIAGDDKKFVWAKAKIISKNKIEVWSDKVKDPKYVRYAWADDPVHPNLYNNEGLPASPFTTDTSTLFGVSYDAALKTASPIPIGVAVGYHSMEHNKTYRKIVTTQFDQVTFENELKNSSVVQPDGQFDYTHADELLKLCKAKGLKIYGHVLCWYQQNSGYLNTLKGDSAAIEQFLKNYITTTVAHYKNDIYAWDVVNEAINASGKLRVTGPDKKGYFYWGKYLGKQYIARAFQYAHKADKNALLFYNDYDLEKYPAKLQAVVKMVKKLKKEGVPIDGVGTQMHISINTANEKIDEAFRALASTGLPVRISELDIKANPSKEPNFVLTKALAQKQADKCLYVFKSYFKNVPAQQRFGITFWNLGTEDSWIRDDSPALYDKNYYPKPMYHEILNFFKKKIKEN